MTCSKHLYIRSTCSAAGGLQSPRLQSLLHTRGPHCIVTPTSQLMRAPLSEQHKAETKNLFRVGGWGYFCPASSTLFPPFLSSPLFSPPQRGEEAPQIQPRDLCSAVSSPERVRTTFAATCRHVHWALNTPNMQTHSFMYLEPRERVWWLQIDALFLLPEI